MSDYPGASMGFGGATGGGTSLGIATAQIMIVTNSGQIKQQIAGDMADVGDTVETAGEKMAGAGEAGAQGFEKASGSTVKLTGGLRTLLTTSRLINMAGDRSAAKVIRFATMAAMVENRFVSLGSQMGGVVAPIEKLGQGILTWTAANLGLDESLAGTIVETGGLAAGLVAFAIPIGVVVAGIIAINNTFAGLAEATKAGIAQLEDFYKIIEKGTTASTQQKLEDDQKALEVAHQKLGDISKTQGGMATDLIKNFGASGGGFVLIASQLGMFGGVAKQVGDEFNKAKDDVTAAQKAVDADTAALKSGKLALNDHSAEVLKATQQDITNSENASKQRLADQKLIEAGNVKAVQDEIKAKQEDYNIQSDLMEKFSGDLKNLENHGGTVEQIKAVSDAWDKAKTAAQEDSDRIVELTKNVADATAGTNLFNQALKAGVGALGDITKGLQSIPTAITKFGEGMQKLSDLVQTHNVEEMNLVLERNLQETRMQEDQNRADLQRKQDFGRQLADEDKREAENQSKGLADAYAKYADAGNKEKEQEQKDLQAYYLTDQRDAQNHQDELLKIQQDSHVSLLKDASHLNAEAVFNDQEQARIKTADANKTYEKDRAQRAQDEALKIADMQKSAQESRNQNLTNALQSLADNKKAYEEGRAQKLQQEADNVKRELENRAIAAKRQEEDFKNQDIARAGAYKKQYDNLVLSITGETRAKATANRDQLTALNNTVAQSKNIWNDWMNTIRGGSNTFIPTTPGTSTSGPRSSGGGAMHLQIGTPNAPYTGMYHLETGEGVMTPATAAAARSALGGNYSQGELRNYLSGSKGGVSIQNFSPVLNIGDIGNRSNGDIEQLVLNAMHKALTKVASGQGA